MRKGERTRRMILEKAAPIFNQKGFSGTALTDLLKATGLQKGGIYRHFASKEKLAADAFDHAWSIVSGPRFAALEEERQSGAERLKGMIARFAEHPSQRLPGGCPLLNTATEADDTNPVLREHARAALEDWKDRVKAAVLEAIDEKQFRKNTNADRVSFIVISSLEGALMISKLERSREALVHVRQHLFDFIDDLRKS